MHSTVSGNKGLKNTKEVEISSTSEQKFKNEKKPKKKYQKFLSSPKEITTTVKTENVDDNFKYKNVKKSSSEFFSIKDFPALKVPEKFPPENNNFNMKYKQWVPLSYGNVKMSDEFFPTLPGNKCIKEDVGSSTIKEEHLELTIGRNIPGINKGKKPNSAKKVPTQIPVQKNPNKKKRADPIFINFQDILTANKIKRKRKQHNIVRTSAQKLKNKELLSGNILDSSNPKRNRGKHREIKKKKLSNLKLTIIKERILKQKMKENHIENSHSSDCFNLINTIDFKTEIKTYLNELNEKKLNLKLNEMKNLQKNNNHMDKKLEEDTEKVTSTTGEDTEKVNSATGQDTKKVTSTTKEDTKKVTSTTEEDTEKVTSVTNEDENSLAVPKGIKFSSKFREYCDNLVTPSLNLAVTEFIKELIELQDRLFLRDPIKAKIKKRHVSGIREVKKYLTLKKVKMIIIAPNLEKLQMEGSVFDSVNQLKSMAASQDIPYGFALNRFKLGRVTKKNAPVSAFAVLNYEGVEAHYEKTLNELMEAKRKFLELVEVKKEEEERNDLNSQIISSLMTAFRDELKVNDQVSTVSGDETQLD